jgi:hypothetical protein
MSLWQNVMEVYLETNIIKKLFVPKCILSFPLSLAQRGFATILPNGIKFNSKRVLSLRRSVIFGRPKQRWEDDIKMDLAGIVCECLTWIHMVQECV